VGGLLVVGWRICVVPSERKVESIRYQGFTLGWYAVSRWGTQKASSIGLIFSDPLGHAVDEFQKLEIRFRRAITVPSLDQF